jgi:small subunit ribosomal protein S4
MARHIGPKWKQSRREKVDLFFRSGSKYQREGRINQPPGVHGPKQHHVKMSNFGTQLREKQKAKHMYGLLEKQFRRIYQQAAKAKENTPLALAQFLELRLDNIIFRFGFTSTRPQARQLVNHGHVLVNDKKVNIPSYQVHIGDIITLSPKTAKLSLISENLEQNYPIPAWLSRKAIIGKILRLPNLDEVDTNIKYNLIVEHYSR